MINPNRNQIPDAINVSMDSCVIKKIHDTKDKIGMKGNSGTLNPPLEICLFFLKKITPIDTIVNASKVPIFVISASSDNGNKPAHQAIRMEKIHVLKTGELLLFKRLIFWGNN